MNVKIPEKVDAVVELEKGMTARKIPTPQKCDEMESEYNTGIGAPA